MDTLPWPYRTVLADPPWPESGGGRIKRGADRHYELMTVEEITGLAGFVQGLADEDCHLYLWATNNYLEAGFRVARAWGFRPLTVITWAKEGKIGLGQYFRGLTEHCIFAVRGNLPYRVTSDGGRAQGTTLITAPRGRHSEKPLGLIEMAERVSYPPRIELFARQRREGWDAWGDELSPP